MSILPAEASQRIAEAIVPTSGEVVRAKRHFLEVLAPGNPLTPEDLMQSYFEEIGIAQYAATGELLNVPTGLNAADAISPADPLVARVRLRMAATTALDELTSDGLLMEVDHPNFTVSVPVGCGPASGGEHMHVGLHRFSRP